MNESAHGLESSTRDRESRPPIRVDIDTKSRVASTRGERQHHPIMRTLKVNEDTKSGLKVYVPRIREKQNAPAARRCN